MVSKSKREVVLTTSLFCVELAVRFELTTCALRMRCNCRCATRARYKNITQPPPHVKNKNKNQRRNSRIISVGKIKNPENSMVSGFKKFYFLLC